MSAIPSSHRCFLAVLCGAFAIWWVALGIAPRHPSDWWLENVLIFFTAAVLVVSARWFVFSRTGYVLAVVFACLHVVGAHYTYSEVPVDAWSDALTGKTMKDWFGWERNHFDRIIHFLYGLLITWPYREAFFHASTVRHSFWGYLLPFSFILSTSLGYEMLEWLAAVVLGGDLGMAFLGTQGDIWDAHWDMLAATVGALICTIVMIGLHVMTGRDFPREWGESWGRRESSSRNDPEKPEIKT